MKSLSYFVFGVNHKSAPVSVREAFEMNAEKMCRLYAETAVPDGSEWIVLSTCNRTEVFVVGHADTVLQIQAGIESLCGPWPTSHSFIYENEEAVRHVFEVTAGLRSQILGDAQILGQVKDAYRLATQHETVGPRLHRLMHTAFACAKSIISSTALGSGGTSIARIAVNTVKASIAESSQRIEDLSVLVLGAGDMGTRILKELSQYHPASCYVTNRTENRAEKLADHYEASVIPWEERVRIASTVDVVFSTTGAGEYVIRSENLEHERLDSPTTFIDISVPRNIDPAISTIPGYTVLNIDQLSSSENGQSAVRRDVGRALKTCDGFVSEAMGWENQTRAVEPAVRTLHETFETIRRREVDRNLHRFSANSHQDVERLTRSIMQKLIAIPIVRLKAMAENDQDLAERIELLGGLFDKGGCEE